MIGPDLDLLIFACNDGSELHRKAAAWWAELVNGTETVGMPCPRYLEILEQILATTEAITRLVADATIAALALENDAEVHTNNGKDFQRFPGLLWRNPLT